MRNLAIGLLTLAVAACAPLPNGFDIAPPTEINRVQWPPPSSGERTRYELVGQITGERNFRAFENNNPGLLSKAWRLLVGLGGRSVRRDGLQRPHSVLIDGQGRLVVTDVSRREVLVFDPKASSMLRWPHDDVPLDWLPIGLAVGLNGTLLVTDAEGARVHRLDTQGRYIGHFGEAVLVRPTGIARDPVARLIYVADTRAHNIKVFSDEGRLIDLIGGPGTGDGRLNSPTAITWVDDRLYVIDTMNARVQVFEGSGKLVQIIGRRGHYVGNFAHPKGLAVDSDGNIYVTESRHDRLLVFTSQGQFALAIGETGSAEASLYLPAGIWIDEHDRVLVADKFNGRISVFQYFGDSK